MQRQLPGMQIDFKPGPCEALPLPNNCSFLAFHIPAGDHGKLTTTCGFKSSSLIPCAEATFDLEHYVVYELTEILPSWLARSSIWRCNGR